MWYAGKVDSRNSCQRKLGGVETSPKRRNWKAGIRLRVMGCFFLFEFGI
jgi:hypothetical protein